VTRVAVVAALALVAAGCGGSSAAKQPDTDPEQAALKIVQQIVHNRYTEAWDDLHPADQDVAPRTEYVGCESRSPVIAVPRSAKPLAVEDESVGLGDGTFVDSKAVAVQLGFAGGFKLTHTVHLVASGGKWTWILPSWRYRDYKADRCPTDAGSTQPTTS
jgi:hypothetical protein